MEYKFVVLANILIKLFNFSLILSFAPQYLSSEVLIVYSDFTREIIPSLISDIQTNILNQTPVEIMACDFSFLKEEISMHPNLLAIFDITCSLNTEFEIAVICEQNFIVHFVVSNSLLFQSSWSFSLSSSKESLTDALVTTLTFFNWTDGIAISNAEKYLNSKQSLWNYSQSIEIISINSDTYIQGFVQREIVRHGSSLFYVFTNKKISIEVQKNLVESKILTKGTGILLIGESSYGSNLEGALGLVDKGRELVDSNEKYWSAAISDMIFTLTNFSNSDESLKVLTQKCPSHYCSTEFSLINIQNNEKKIIGAITEKRLSLISSVIFPGDSSNIPISQKKVLTFSASDGAYNYGASPNLSVLTNTRGLTLSVNDINNAQDILQNFQLNVNHFDCGASVPNANYSLSCFTKDKDKFGLAHIVATTTPVVRVEMSTFQKLNITMPLVGAASSEVAFSNKSNFPFFSRISLPSSFAYTQIPLIFKVMGWSSIALIYQNDSIGIAVEYYVRLAAEKQNLKIVNKLQVIPAVLTRETIKNWYSVYQEIIDLNVRLVVLGLASPLGEYSAEVFYDLGLRKGDVFLFSANPIFITSVAAKDDYTYKRVEVGVPSMIAFQSLYVGKKGKQVHDDLYSIYKTEPTSYACLYYDAVYLIAASLDWTINRGNDYTDPYTVQSAIRTVKFVGCTGSMYIQNEGNDRLFSSLTIQSNSYNETTGLSVYAVGYLTPSGSKILTISTPMIYADGTTNKPTDFRVTRTNCPFDDKLKQTFYKGRALVFGICFFIAAITAVITFIIWKKWWNRKVEPLVTSEEISVADLIVGITIAVEFFQLLSMGPDIRPLNSFIADIGDALSLDLESFVKLENGVFWWIAIVVIVLCALWVVFCLEIFFQLDEKFYDMWAFRALGFLADNSMPVLGNLCFIPFISILLEVFVCDHSIGNNFTDSYLTKDCYQFCWQGDHIIYVIFSSFALACYEPFAVFCRPLWQEFQNNLHVKAVPMYLMVKTVIQVILIVLNKTLKRASDVAHGFAFTFAILIYIGIIWKFKAYNYGRFNWWQQLSLIGVAWVDILCIMNFLIGSSNFPWAAIILGGWVLIICIGLIVQRKKYPSLLYRKKGKDTSILFKFAFTFGRNSKILRSKIVPQSLDLLKSK
ncbi:unnamed protein product [Blepharisma stoltei]|uniref:Receptor ligand binding region domain-containing protein n=1 Tax=Blepharisma stoltei TaxID=1481888 RepID=A0AAU9K143_9CILI|nr:unnamed protein product [Blepharisma stoltei]